jgi:dCTP deaminase
MIISAAELWSRLRRAAEGDDDDPLIIAPSPTAQTLPAGGAAVDLRLGTWFLSLRSARVPHLSAGETGNESRLAKLHYVCFGDEYFLHPGGFVLGITLEWLRMPRDVAAYVIGKSSWGRRGLIIATATGVHPGFAGCLALELSNVGEVPIGIRPGMTICQLFVETVHPPIDAEPLRSQYAGGRKPKLGQPRMDEMARRLAQPAD